MKTRPALALVALVFLAACGHDEVSSEEDAERAYLGLHQMIDRALNLGMDGYNAASSANIPPQMGEGSLSGTIRITGQVDQGVSPNKEMRLFTALVEYADEVEADEDEPFDLVYDTDEEALPALNLSLRSIPNGTFTGTLSGIFFMTGELEGDVELRLSMSGEIEPLPGGPDGSIRRTPGSTTVTGEAESIYGVYVVDLAL